MIIKARIKNSKGEWTEEFEIPVGQEKHPEVYIKEIVGSFNSSLEERELPREFVKIISQDLDLSKLSNKDLSLMFLDSKNKMIGKILKYKLDIFRGDDVEPSMKLINHKDLGHIFESWYFFPPIFHYEKLYLVLEEINKRGWKRLRGLKTK